MKYDFIEIGTSNFDTILEKSNDVVIGLSIEPLKFYLDQLPNKLNIQKLNYAISDKDYFSKIYYVDPKDIITHSLPDWFHGCNSINSPHPQVSRILKQQKLEHLIKENICECMTWNSLCSKYNIDSVEHLKTDTEGHDHIIINHILSTSNILPNTIHYESNELTAEIEKVALLNKLKQNGYQLIADDGYTRTVSKRLNTTSISAKTKQNIFLDCGGHHLEGLAHVINQKIIDETFEIHIFEPNPECRIEDRLKTFQYNPLNYTLHQKLVWTSDGNIAFNQENHIKSGSGSPTDGTSELDGWGSSAVGIGYIHGGYSEPIMVECIDFSRFIRELPAESNIICKLDIEGSEFAVLRKLLDDGTINKISKLYVEFHNYQMPHISYETTSNLILEIQSRGIEINMWGH